MFTYISDFVHVEPHNLSEDVCLAILETTREHFTEISPDTTTLRQDYLNIKN